MRKCRHCGTPLSHNSTFCRACGGNVDDVLALESSNRLPPLSSSWTSGKIWKLSKSEILLSALIAMVCCLGLYAIVMGDTSPAADKSDNPFQPPVFTGKVSAADVAKTGAWQLVKQRMKHRSAVWLICCDIRENTASHYLLKVKIGFRNSLGKAINDYFNVIIKVKDDKYSWDTDHAVMAGYLSPEATRDWKIANGWR